MYIALKSFLRQQINLLKMLMDLWFLQESLSFSIVKGCHTGVLKPPIRNNTSNNSVSSKIMS